jgi:hypothetical protein
MFWRRKADNPSLLPLAALISQTGSGRGAPPTAAEFRALSEGTLSPERRAEIESQLAHDPAVFRAFMASVNTRRANGTRAPRARSWLFSPVALGAAASLAICVVILGLFASFDAPSRSQDSRLARTQPARPAATPTPMPDWRRRAVRYGIENPGWFSGSDSSMQGQSFGGDCGSGDCDQEIDALTDFGVVVARLAEECLQSPDPATPLDAGSHRRQIEALLAEVDDRHWNSEMQNLARTLARPAREACPAVARLIRAAGANRN